MPDQTAAAEQTDEPLDYGEQAAHHRRHLLEEVMPFWQARTRDSEGGFFTMIDRAGNLKGQDKYIWVQARQTYTFAALHNLIDSSGRWLELARHGRDFLVSHAHAGGGRWHYRLDRTGKVLDSSPSMATDAFALLGLCEHAMASGSTEDAGLIRETFDAFERNMRDPWSGGFHHFVLEPLLEYHAPHMLAVNTSSVAAQLLGAERVRALQDASIHRILHRFAKDEHEALFESLDRQGRVVDSPQGMCVNPGHVLESMWFCMEEGMARADAAIVRRGVQIADWHYRKARDELLGGLFAFIHPSGGEPWLPQVVKDIGENWDSKIWWVHAEALYAFALCYHLTGDPVWAARYRELDSYCRAHFYDQQYGEWYMYLHRDGTPKNTDKGNAYKSAFHIPRALMKLVDLFEGHAGPEPLAAA